MPSTVLTASSICCGDLGLHLLGRGAGQRRADGDGGQVDGREAVDAELEVAAAADHDQRQDQHGREDRPADTDFGELLHAASAHARRRPGRRSGSRARRRPPRRPRRPSSTSTLLADAPPGSHALLDDLAVRRRRAPSSMPAKVTSADAGTSTAGCSGSMTISAVANAPGRSAPSGFGTSASTSSVRLLSSIAGLSRATRPVVPGSVPPSTRTRPAGRRARSRPRARAPRAAGAAGRCARSSRPARRAARYSPTSAWRSRTRRRTARRAPRRRAAGAPARARPAAAASSGLAVPDLLERVLVARLGDLVRRLGGVELGARDELLVPEARQEPALPRLQPDFGVYRLDSSIVVLSVGLYLTFRRNKWL